MWKKIKKSISDFYNRSVLDNFDLEPGENEYEFGMFFIPYIQTCYRYAAVFIAMSAAMFIIQNILWAKFLRSLTTAPQKVSLSHNRDLGHFYSDEEKKFYYGTATLQERREYKKWVIRYKDLTPVSSIQYVNLFLYFLPIPLYLLLIAVCNYPEGNYFMEFSFDFDYLIFKGVNVRPSFIIDNVSAFFLITTICVGLWVNLFSPTYIKGEVGDHRFETLLNSFFFSMIFLILSSDLITFIFFWELIGFTSFFLINFHSVKSSTFKSAMKAFTYNQISDVSLITATILYFKAYGTFRFPNDGIASIASVESSQFFMSVTLLFFFIAASCKSVQFFLHFWLPDSMDAPVPASALIHSATLVAAGIYLVLRIKPLFVWSSACVNFFSYLSLITIVVGGLAATAHLDLKKILAYSTISNCGYMMFFAINAKEIDTLVFFSTHGLLKGLSFVLIGFIILDLNHRQDIRYVSGLGYLRPCLLAGVLLTVGTLGSLPSSCMASIKHDVMSNTTAHDTSLIFTNLCLAAGSITSVIYSLKVILLVFFFGIFKIKTVESVIKSSNNFDMSYVTVLGAIIQLVMILYVYLFFFIKTDMLPYIYTHGLMYNIENAKPTILSDSFIRTIFVLGQYCAVIMMSIPMFYKTSNWWNNIAYMIMSLLILASCLTY